MLAVGASESGMCGARSGGMLKEAKMVMLSRRQKRVYEILGIWGCVCDCGCGGLGV